MDAFRGEESTWPTAAGQRKVKTTGVSKLSKHDVTYRSGSNMGVVWHYCRGCCGGGIAAGIIIGIG